VKISRDPSLRRFDTIPACNRRTGGQTDILTVACKNSRMQQSANPCHTEIHSCLVRFSEIRRRSKYQELNNLNLHA